MDRPHQPPKRSGRSDSDQNDNATLRQESLIDVSSSRASQSSSRPNPQKVSSFSNLEQRHSPFTSNDDSHVVYSHGSLPLSSSSTSSALDLRRSKRRSFQDGQGVNSGPPTSGLTQNPMSTSSFKEPLSIQTLSHRQNPSDSDFETSILAHSSSNRSMLPSRAGVNPQSVPDSSLKRPLSYSEALGRDVGTCSADKVDPLAHRSIHSATRGGGLNDRDNSLPSGSQNKQMMDPSVSTSTQSDFAGLPSLSLPTVSEQGASATRAAAVDPSLGDEESRSIQQAPPPLFTNVPLFNPDTRTFKLTIRQQPHQGRLCGLGSKDKRPLDPLPIIQLQIYKQNNEIDVDAQNSPSLMMQVSLTRCDPISGQDRETTLIETNDTSYPLTRMLEGKLVASANVVRDLDGSKACFFVFTDLSIRQEGSFRLIFKLIVLGPLPAGAHQGASSSGSNVVAQVVTQPFTVYSPRRFPGMTESTELAKSLARQGVQVPIRNDVRRRQE